MTEARKRPWVIVSMFGLGVLPILLAVIVYFTGWGIPDGRTNNGHLIVPPLDIKNLAFKASDVGNEHTWWILTFDDGMCETICQKKIYHVRQINTALGKNQERVQHGVILTQSLDAKSDLFFKDYPHLKHFLTNQSELEKWLGAGIPKDAVDQHMIIIVDPLGNVMLYYTPDQDPRDILDDLNKLLKYSTIG